VVLSLQGIRWRVMSRPKERMAGAPLGAVLCDRLLFGVVHETHGGKRLCNMRSPSDAEARSDSAGHDAVSALVLYSRRWLMLLLFCLLSCVNGAMWIQFASVANICQSYFGTSALAIDWLSMIYMALYIPGDAPVPRAHCCLSDCLRPGH
jgi:hypothetical protein